MLHWGAALVLLAAFALGLGLEAWPRGGPRDGAMMVHASLGTLVLASVTLRLMRRLVVRQEASRPGLAGWVAGAGHWAMYGLMLALPMTGAFDRWARGRKLVVFGDTVIAPPFAVPGGKIWEEVHETLAWTLLALVAAHVGAALWHHVVLRDGVMRRMWPGRGVAAGV